MRRVGTEASSTPVAPRAFLPPVDCPEGLVSGNRGERSLLPG
jgi:hypothetical protein